MDLRVWECSSRCVRGMHAEHEYNRPPTDDELVGELVKRGVLTEETSTGCHSCDKDKPTPHPWKSYVSSRRFVSEYEYGKPVGSVEGTP